MSLQRGPQQVARGCLDACCWPRACSWLQACGGTTSGMLGVPPFGGWQCHRNGQAVLATLALKSSACWSDKQCFTTRGQAQSTTDREAPGMQVGCRAYKRELAGGAATNLTNLTSGELARGSIKDQHGCKRTCPICVGLYARVPWWLKPGGRQGHVPGTTSHLRGVHLRSLQQAVDHSHADELQGRAREDAIATSTPRRHKATT